MIKLKWFKILSASLVFSFVILPLLAFQPNSISVQASDYKQLMIDYKTALRSYYSDTQKAQDYPIPVIYDNLIYILTEDGKPNTQIQIDLKYETNEQVWDKKGRVKVVSWMSKWAYNNFWAPTTDGKRTRTGKTSIDSFSSDHRPWVGVSGDLRDYFLIRQKGSVKDKADATVRVAQLQGMPIPFNNDGSVNTEKVFVEFWVNPNDLYRPTRTVSIKKDNIPHDLSWRVHDNFNPDTSIYDNAKYQYISSKWEMVSYSTSDTKYPIYTNSYKNDLEYHLYGSKGDTLRGEEYDFPFTALGYTYNWHNYNPSYRDCLKDDEHIGTNEFVLKGGSSYELDGVYETYDYITNEQPHSILPKEEIKQNSDQFIPFEDKRLKEAS